MMPVLKKVLPTGMVLLTAVWLCWGYLSGAADFHIDEGDTLPHLSASALRPKLIAPSPRDPFLVRTRYVAPQGEDDQPVVEPQRAPEVLPDPGEMVAQLQLSATFVINDRRVAVINQSHFHEGERIVHEDFPDFVGMVQAIEKQRVVLRVDGEQFALHYPGFDGTHFVRLTSRKAAVPSEQRTAPKVPWGFRKLMSVFAPPTANSTEARPTEPTSEEPPSAETPRMDAPMSSTGSARQEIPEPAETVEDDGVQNSSREFSLPPDVEAFSEEGFLQ